MIKILLSRKLGELRWAQADLSRATGSVCKIDSSNKSIEKLTLDRKHIWIASVFGAILHKAGRNPF